MAETLNYVLFDFWELEGDPRIASYPFFSGGPWLTWSIISFYIYFVKYLGPSLMKNRDPFVLKYPILFYNVGMIFLNTYFFYHIVVTFRFGLDMNMWNFQRPDLKENSPKTMKVVQLSYLFLISKFLDLIETIFFVLRKKHNQITNLHVYHHSAVPILVHMFAKISASGGPGTMFPFLNCFIHIVMYCYYSMAALGLHKYLWWKRYLTQLQLAQFVIFGIYGSVFVHLQTGYPRFFDFLGLSQPVVFFCLFLSFYRSSYLKSKAQTQNVQQQQSLLKQHNIHQQTINATELKKDK